MQMHVQCLLYGSSPSHAFSHSCQGSVIPHSSSLFRTTWPSRPWPSRHLFLSKQILSAWDDLCPPPTITTGPVSTLNSFPRSSPLPLQPELDTASPQDAFFACTT